MKHAVVMVAIVALLILCVHAVDEASKHKLGGGGQASNQLTRQDRYVEVNIGQTDPKEDGGDGGDDPGAETLKGDFPELFESSGQIVSFTAAWCTACPKQKIQIRALERRFHVLTFDIDTDKGKQLFDHIGGSAVPCTVIFTKGVPKKRWDGYVSATEIEQFAVLAKKEPKNEEKRTVIYGRPTSDPNGSGEGRSSGRGGRHSQRHPIRSGIPPSPPKVTEEGRN